MSSVLLDAELDHEFCDTLQTANLRALSEAANTGGIILDVSSIEIEMGCILFVGCLPNEALAEGSGTGLGRARLRPRGLGKFRTTWGALMQSHGQVGFLVLHPPLALLGGQPSDEAATTRVAVEIKRCFSSMPPGWIGPVCCAECNQEIPRQRLQAVPATRVCAKCKQRKEKSQQ